MNAMLLLKATVLLLATLAAARMLRRAPAGVRHRFWTGVFAGLLALPVLVATVPALHVPMPDQWINAGASRDAIVRITDPVTNVDPLPRGVEATVSMPARDSSAAIDPPADAGAALDARSVLIGAWLVGVLAAAATLTLSLVRVGRLARSSGATTDPHWQRAADDLAARFGLRRPPRLLSSPAVTTPMAAGILRPTIFLPLSARTWTAELREIVLAHEIAHLVARDPLRHLITRVAMACYWFHPAAWMAAREAEVAREQACDEAVLSLGTRPSSYARVLLEFADAAPRLESALPIVQPSLLEKRLMAILNGDVQPISRRMLLVPAAGVALLTLTVAAAHPGARASTPPVPAQAVDAGIATPPVPVVGTVPHIPTVPDVQPIEAREAVAPSLAEAAVPPQDVDVASGCGWIRGRSFSGNISMDDSGGRRVIHEQVGSSGSDRVIQQSFRDLRICMRAEGVGPSDLNANERPSQWLDRASRVVMETRSGSRVQQLEIVQAGGGRRTTWRTGGAERPMDQAAQQWRTQLLAVLDTTWELSMLRGQVSSLRGEISSIEGERSSLRGEISSLRGEVSSMRGHASSILGEESSLRGEISSIRGHVSSLRGAISSERGAISSLNANRYWDRADRERVDALIASHEKEITRLEQEIRDFNEDARVAAVEKQIQELNAAKKVAQIEAEIKAFDVERRVAEVEREIAKLDVDGQVRAIEGRIRGLDADRRGRQLEDRRESELKRLEAAISAIR